MSIAREALNAESASVAKVLTEADTVFSSTSVAKVSSKDALNCKSCEVSAAKEADVPKVRVRLEANEADTDPQSSIDTSEPVIAPSTSREPLISKEPVYPTVDSAVLTPLWKYREDVAIAI